MQILSDDDLRKAAPSIFATHAADSVSERYLYLPSYVAVREMRLIGMEPVMVRSGWKKSPDGNAFAIHEVRFQSRNGDYVKPELGNIRAEAVLLNSHDRTSPMTMSAGLQRLVCLNGMRVADQEVGFKVRHVGKRGMDMLMAGITKLQTGIGRGIEVAEAWNKIELSPEQQLAFARRALDIRGTSLSIEPLEVLKVRRFLDDRNDLWSVFNRAQENITKGGLAGRTTTNKRQTLKGIKSLIADVEWNTKLWAAASELAAEVTPSSISMAEVA